MFGLNDDVPGRTLDAIAAYGPTELFNEIVAKCLLQTEFGSHCVHIDTTNFSVTGAYESDLNMGEIEITYGHPKDGRWDLKRFVLGIASNQYGVPLFLQTFSGNESDKETILTIIKQLKENLKSAEKVCHVADSAFYTATNLQSLGQHTFWISRVPATIKEVRDLVRTGEPFLSCTDDRYRPGTSRFAPFTPASLCLCPSAFVAVDRVLGQHLVTERALLGG